MVTKKNQKEMKKVVVKIGSSVIAPGGKLDSSLILRLVKDILTAEKKGYKIVLVSSGAIACGLEELGHKKKPQDTHALMAVSSLGQILLMDAYNDKFKKYKRRCAQLLLTWDDFDNRKRFINIRKTIDKLLAMDVVPIINENDAVAHEEIGVGDNDRLSAFVADLIGAEQLIILSDVEGLLDGQNLVKEVSQINSEIRSLVKRQVKTHTSGGMDTKLQAATKACLSGIKTIIAYGREKEAISRIIAGEEIGTSFLPSSEIEKSRKRWIDTKQVKGVIAIDNGAKEALLNKGKSLLLVGITEITTGFNKGDAVTVTGSNGCIIGCGMVNYSSEELERAGNKRLEKAVIHRDNFVKVRSDWCYHPDKRFSKQSKKLK